MGLPRRRTLAVLLASALTIASPARAEVAPCRVSGAAVRIERVTVAPAGVHPFFVQLEGVSVEAEPARGRRPHAVRVGGPLAFEGASRDLRYWLADRTTLFEGVVELAKTVRLERVRAEGGSVRSTVRLGRGISLDGLAIPCGALTLDEPPAPGPPVRSGGTLVPRRRTIAFWARPGAGARVRVRVEVPSAFKLLRLSPGEEQGAWHRLRWAGDDGSRIEGFVARSAVEPSTFGRWHSGSMLRGRGCWSDAPAALPGVYLGPATVTLGTPVMAEPGRGEWATFEHAEPVEVRHVEGEPWVQLLTVPGIREGCEHLAHAWVPMTAVRLPSADDTPPP